jgi:phenylalanyl-tRNA synthetase beta chain
MLLPRFWLHDHCAPDLSTEALVDRLDLTGTKVERTYRHGVGSPERFVVGRVRSAEPHPDADRLRVCEVEVGNGTVNQIVCGAPNVVAGQTVAVALPGAVMPDGTELGAARLRGVQSEGMILAEDELAIGPLHDGIIVLQDGPAPGTPLASVLPIGTDVLELEITPNRPDCLGVYGVAREVHAATGAPLGPPPWSEDSGSAGALEGAVVVVEDPDLCPRFTARVFDDVTIGPSPEWLKARLVAAGQRPISNVVDITNYVMLLSGQPLHAFDLDRVAGARLVVRRAQEGEVLETLDGERRALDSDMVVIADDDGTTSLAGIMGGLRSEVQDDTTRVLLEVATWNGPNINRTSQRLAVRSEASARFEKQLSAESTLEAQALATRLLIELCGATVRPGTIDVGGSPSPPAPIRMRDLKLARLLGKEVPRSRSAEILRDLDFAVAEAVDGLEVIPPHFRREDVSREADLIEEVARIDGLENLPAAIPATRSAPGADPRPAGLTVRQALRRRAQDALADRGLYETLGWAFTDPSSNDRLRLAPGDPRRDLVALANPMSAEQSVLRSLLLGSLLDAARANLARGAAGVRLFEAAPVYLATGPATRPDEPVHLGALLTGPARPPTWREPSPPAADVFAAKGVLAGVLDDLRAPWSVRAAAEPFLHPGRSAAVLVEGRPVGWLGELHPLVVRTWDLEGGAAFEVDLDAVTDAVEGRVELYEDVTSFPAVRRDLAVLLPPSADASDLLDLVRREGSPLVDRAEIFDYYEGPQTGDRVSVALHVSYRAPDRTLTDREVQKVEDRIVRAVAEMGGELRA